jgi:hypothetical protein
MPALLAGFGELAKMAGRSVISDMVPSPYTGDAERVAIITLFIV